MPKKPRSSRKAAGRPRDAAKKGKKAPAKRRAVAKPKAREARRGGAAVAQAWPPPEDRRAFFDSLDLLRKVLIDSDMLFLSRQIAYHMAAASNLPKVFADAEQLRFVLSKLLEHVVKRSARRSSIAMEIRTHSLRSEPGVEIRMQGTDRLTESKDASTLMAALYSPIPDEQSGVSLSKLRETLLGMHGRMWVDLPKPSRPLYHLVLPASEQAMEKPTADSQTFKYDIHIMNFANVRKRFGIRKSASLVEQIERYVMSIVRYPMDMVMSLPDKGTVTTIYETQGGAAESLASRISQRLGKEDFRIGRRPVELTFSYKLSALPVTHPGHDKPEKKRRR